MHFSIITVVKNDLSGLKKSRESLEVQKFQKWTHIIIDGGSTDGTISYLKKLPKENTVYISEPDKGIYDAMNKAWRMAAEDSFVFYLNARDVMTDPRSLTYARKALAANANANWGCTTHEESYEDGSGWVCKLISHPSIRNQLYAFGYRSHQAVVMKKSFIENLGGFNENFNVAADWDLIVRAISSEKPIMWTHPLARFELGGMSSGRMFEAHLELRKLREEYLRLRLMRRFVDDLWCAVHLRFFGYQNYWTPLLKIVFPEEKKFRHKTRKSRRRSFSFNLFGIRVIFSRSSQKIPRLRKGKVQFALQKWIRSYLGITDYL